MKKYIKLPEGENKFLKVEVDYSLGGMNYFNGQTARRGVYLFLRAVEVNDERGYRTESFMMFGEKKDGKRLLKETGRDNKKLTTSLAEKIFAISDADLLEYYNTGANEAVSTVINSI